MIKFFKKIFSRLMARRIIVQDSKGLYRMESKDTPFGKQVEKLISEHVDLIRKEEDPEMMDAWLRDFLSDYEELLIKYGRTIPAKFSTELIPNDVLVKEGEETAVNLIQSFSGKDRKKIIRDVTEIIYHLAHAYGYDTPIWVDFTQYKEEEK